MRVAILALLLTALAAPASAAAAERSLYVSLGDSWAMSVQGSTSGIPRFTESGFSEQLVRQQRARGKRWRLVQLGCAGARSDEMVRGKRSGMPCFGHTPPYRGRSAPTSQLAYAERYLRRHRARVALVTVVISGNDLYQCVRDGSADFDCITRELERVRTDVAAIARRLRAAAGRRVPIVGLGYPDLFLSYWIDPDTRFLAGASQGIFRDSWMPKLRAAYRASRATFIDLAAEFGSYGSLATAGENVPPYGNVPRPVAIICRETWFCQNGDIHPRTSGYTRIARVIRQGLR